MIENGIFFPIGKFFCLKLNFKNLKVIFRAAEAVEAKLEH